MNRTPSTPPTLVDIGARADEIDPWSEFLSETPDGAEAQAFDSEAAAVEPHRPAHVAAPDLPVAPVEERRASLLADPVEPRQSVTSLNVTWADDFIGERSRHAEEPPAIDARTPDRSIEDALSAPRPTFSLAMPSARPVDDVPGDEGHAAPALDADADEHPAAGPQRHEPPEMVRLRSTALTQGKAAPTLVAPKADATPAPTRKSAEVAAASERGLSLADVIARHVSVNPAEAVAVIAQLCTVLGDRSQPSDTVPEMRDVLVTSAGTVVVRARARNDQDVRALGRMLHGLVAGSTTPLPLRLFITSAISSDRYRSIASFAEALSHYESSGRRELIRDLYQRAWSTPPVVPLVRRDAQPSWTETVAFAKGRPRTRMPVTIVAILVGIAAGAAFWVWQASLGPAPDRRARVNTTSESAAGTAVAPRDDWKLGQIEVPEPEPAPKPVRPRPVDMRPAESSRRPATVQAEPAPAATPPPSQRDVSLPPAPLASRVPARSASTVREADIQTDPTIYTSANIDVQPATLLPSQRLVLPPTLAEPVTNTLEFIVNQRGEVQKVTLINRPQNFSDVGLLSQAKMLKFRPAQRNGRPVNYLLQMTFSGARR